MSDLGKILVILGIILIILGAIFIFGSKISFFGKVPGDIYVKKENFTFYFPLTTSIIVSLFLSFILYIISRFLK